MCYCLGTPQGQVPINACPNVLFDQARGQLTNQGSWNSLAKNNMFFLAKQSNQVSFLRYPSVWFLTSINSSIVLSSINHGFFEPKVSFLKFDRDEAAGKDGKTSVTDSFVVG